MSTMMGNFFNIKNIVMSLKKIKNTMLLFYRYIIIKKKKKKKTNRS